MVENDQKAKFTKHILHGQCYIYLPKLSKGAFVDKNTYIEDMWLWY